jgi:hypothetical protein
VWAAQENNEMLQWCYAFVSKNCPDGPQGYRALQRRLAAMAKQRPARGNNTHASPHAPSTLQQDQLPNDVRPDPLPPNLCPNEDRGGGGDG